MSCYHIGITERPELCAVNGRARTNLEAIINILLELLDVKRGVGCIGNPLESGTAIS